MRDTIKCASSVYYIYSFGIFLFDSIHSFSHSQPNQYYLTVISPTLLFWDRCRSIPKYVTYAIDLSFAVSCLFDLDIWKEYNTRFIGYIVSTNIFIVSILNVNLNKFSFPI